MSFRKPKKYSGRWLVKMVEAALIFGVVFFGLDALGQLIHAEPVERHIVVYQADVNDAATSEDPADVEAVELDAVDYFYLALDHQQDGDYYDAIMDYNRVISMDDSIAAAYLNRGVAYEQIGGCSGYQAASDFYVWMTRDNLVVETLPAINTTDEFEMELNQNHRYDLPINLVAGQSVNISVASVDEDVVDPIIVLLGPDGEIVTANDDMRYSDGDLLSMNPSIRNLNIRSDGEYTLLISHAGGGWDDDVTVSVTINK